MKFCKECQSILTPKTHSGVLTFVCKCQKTYPGVPEDTLRFEEYEKTIESTGKYQTFIEQAPFDQAGLKVNKQCTKCGIPFLTMIYIGKDKNVLYVCDCGARFTNEKGASTP